MAAVYPDPKSRVSRLFLEGLSMLRTLATIAACALVMTLGGSSLAPSFGAPGRMAAVPSGGMHAIVAVPCRGNARSTLTVDRSVNESGNPEAEYSFRVYGRPGSRWQYYGLLRVGSRRVRDHASMTVGPPSRPYWVGSYRIILSRARPLVTVRVRGEGPSGQLCRTRFTQRPS